MSSREERENNHEEEEYPTDDPAPAHEPVSDDAAGNHEEQEEEQDDGEKSMSDSEAADEEAAKEYPGRDLRAAPREHGGLYVMIMFNIFTFVSFVFTLTASTTVAWYRASNGDEWSLWENFDGTKWKDVECDHKRQMFQAMASFTIISCVFSLATLIAGVLQTFGVGHMGVSLVLCFFTFSFTLVAWSLAAHQYHKYNCPGEIAYVDLVNRLNAGFSLVICSNGLLFMNLVALSYYFFAYFSFTEEANAARSNGALVSAFVIGVCLLITCVGSCFTMWEDYSVSHKLKVTLWHVEMLDVETGLSEYFSYKDYNCDALNKYFQAGEAFAIISAAFLFPTLLLAVGAAYNKICKWASIGLGVASWVFLLVCWAIMVGARYKTFCDGGMADPRTNGLPMVPQRGAEQQVDYTGFVITEGLGMIISAWCIMTLALVFFGIRG